MTAYDVWPWNVIKHHQTDRGLVSETCDLAMTHKGSVKYILGNELRKNYFVVQIKFMEACLTTNKMYLKYL